MTELYITKHAWERLRQRVGIESRDAGIAWVTAKLSEAEHKEIDGHQTKYHAGSYTLVMDGNRLVTIQPSKTESDYSGLLKGKLAKEARSFIGKKKAELRKLEIALLETQINLLKAKNPKIKRSIADKLSGITDEKYRIEDAILGMRIAAQSMGVEDFRTFSEEV
ncbi:hypothetical protein [Oceanobacillus sojae]|uniref:hypothetical protein n=1 Tax=Oceanobacillus sojae TaxID=582851 RepID=UPI00362DBED2